jgi:hypothetical protein
MNDNATELYLKAYIFDLDGTLADIRHREWLLKKSPKRWDEFFAKMKGDKPNLQVIEMAKILHQAGFRIVVATGRPERYRKETILWLSQNLVPVAEIYMRPEGDFRSDSILKEEWLSIISEDCEIMGVFEDRKSVVQMYRNCGLTVFQVADGDF